MADTKTITYNGPTGQVSIDVAQDLDQRADEDAAPAALELEPGRSYTVAAELADRLVETSAWFGYADSGDAEQHYSRMTVAELDGLAATRALDDYPADAVKADKIAALVAADERGNA